MTDADGDLATRLDAIEQAIKDLEGAVKQDTAMLLQTFLQELETGPLALMVGRLDAILEALGQPAGGTGE